MAHIGVVARATANLLHVLNPKELRFVAHQINEILTDTGNESDTDARSESTVRPFRNNSPVQRGEGGDTEPRRDSAETVIRHNSPVQRSEDGNNAPTGDGDTSSKARRHPGGAIACLGICQNMRLGSIGGGQTARTE